jgi:hypothetical protein
MIANCLEQKCASSPIKTDDAAPRAGDPLNDQEDDRKLIDCSLEN